MMSADLLHCLSAATRFEGQNCKNMTRQTSSATENYNKVEKNKKRKLDNKEAFVFQFSTEGPEIQLMKNNRIKLRSKSKCQGGHTQVHE